MKPVLWLALTLLGFPAFAAEIAPPPSVSTAAPTAQTFSQLEDDYWDMQMRLSPLSATEYGYPKHNDALDDIGAAGRADDLRSSKAMLQRLLAVDRSALDEADKINYDVMKLELERRIEWHQYKLWQWDVNHMDGGQSEIPAIIAEAQPMRTAEDAEALILRLKQVPVFFAEQTSNLREGLKEGRVAAKVPVEKLIAELDGLISTPPEKSPFAEAVDRLPPDLKAQYAPEIYEAVETHVLPAFSDYRRFLKEEYLPHARTGQNIGLSGLPGGLDAYRYLIRYNTTLDLDPQKINRIGLDDLASIHKEMLQVAKHMKFKGDVKALLASMRSDPKNFFSTRAQVLQAAQDDIAEAKTKLPDDFDTFPRTPLVVKPVEAYKEANEVAARYEPPPDDLSRPGVFRVNTYKPETRARFDMMVLAAHEGVPGHHMQQALQIENKSLPAFRRHGDFNAFVEGWALYCERLADEMGLYQDDLSRLGMLSAQAWRASRLVVDTGIHALGWPREQAIQFLKDNTALSNDEIEAEVDRYTVWPGQALAYKLGQREIMELRLESQKKLGRKFDIKKFHDAVLANGAVPLSVLRETVLGETDKPQTASIRP